MDYSQVLNGSAALAGLGSGDIGTAEFTLLRTFHDRRLQAAWEVHAWPDVVVTEQRWFRPKYDSATTYAAGDERFDVVTGAYFQSLQSGNVNHAPTILGKENSAWWAACSASLTTADAGSALWAARTAYAVGKRVQNPADGYYYQCFWAHTSTGVFDGSKWGRLHPFERYVAFEQVEEGPTGVPAGVLLLQDSGENRQGQLVNGLLSWDTAPTIGTGTSVATYFNLVDAVTGDVMQWTSVGGILNGAVVTGAVGVSDYLWMVDQGTGDLRYLRCNNGMLTFTDL